MGEHRHRATEPRDRRSRLSGNTMRNSEQVRLNIDVMGGTPNHSPVGYPRKYGRAASD